MDAGRNAAAVPCRTRRTTKSSCDFVTSYFNTIRLFRVERFRVTSAPPPSPPKKTIKPIFFRARSIVVVILRFLRTNGSLFFFVITRTQVGGGLIIWIFPERFLRLHTFDARHNNKVKTGYYPRTGDVVKYPKRKIGTSKRTVFDDLLQQVQSSRSGFPFFRQLRTTLANPSVGETATSHLQNVITQAHVTLTDRFFFLFFYFPKPRLVYTERRRVRTAFYDVIKILYCYYCFTRPTYIFRTRSAAAAQHRVRRTFDTRPIAAARRRRRRRQLLFLLLLLLLLRSVNVRRGRVFAE